MLPHAYELPAAILLVLGGALACFAGYRLFRLVLGIYGFVIGAMIASSMLDVSSTVGLLVAALVGGVVGALILVLAYFAGIALVGAALGALVAHVVWRQLATVDPPALAVIVASVVGAIGAMLLQRYVIVVATAFGGAWTVLVGAASVAEARGAEHVQTRPDVWILYPFSPNGDWVLPVWVALGLIGTAVQLLLTAGRKR